MSELAADKLDALKVDELKRHLSARGIKVTATMKKSDLVAALRQALEEEQAQAQAQTGEPDAGTLRLSSSRLRLAPVVLSLLTDHPFIPCILINYPIVYYEDEEEEEGAEGEGEGEAEEMDVQDGEGDEGEDVAEGDGDTTALSEEQRKLLRAQRFGLPVSAEGVSAQAAREARKERFGLVSEEDKKAARKERFGVVSADDKRAARKERFGIVTPDEVRKKREERFGKVARASNAGPRRGGLTKRPQQAKGSRRGAPVRSSFLRRPRPLLHPTVLLTACCRVDADVDAASRGRKSAVHGASPWRTPPRRRERVAFSASRSERGAVPRCA